MTSCELTLVFKFWSRLRMAVIHLLTKFGADIFIQYEVIDIFPEIQNGGRRHLGFVGEPWGHPRRLIRGAYLLSPPVKSFVMIG